MEIGGEDHASFANQVRACDGMSILCCVMQCSAAHAVDRIDIRTVLSQGLDHLAVSYVYMFVCMYACMYVCVCMCICMYIRINECICICKFVRSR